MTNFLDLQKHLNLKQLFPKKEKIQLNDKENQNSNFQNFKKESQNLSLNFQNNLPKVNQIENLQKKLESQNSKIDYEKLKLATAIAMQETIENVKFATMEVDAENAAEFEMDQIEINLDCLLEEALKLQARCSLLDATFLSYSN
ncbi:hypothetical protein HDU92_001624 [Lobulomyces angularis]|nr:hypothetical protein HDU92_001624 [Lobulomyces angularis]